MPRAAAGWIVVVLAVSQWAGTAQAADLNAIWPDLNLPGFIVTPFLTEKAEYRSNVFQTPTGASDDLIIKTIPGVVVELPYGPHRLDLGTRAEILRYLDNDDQDAEHYFFLGSLALNFPGGLGVKVRDDLIRTTEPPGTELTGPIESLTNIFAPEAEYGLGGRFAVGVNASWTHVEFEDVTQLDREEQLVGATGFWKFQPKSAVLLNYSYGWKEFDASTRDVTRHLVVVGVRGDITSRLASTLRIGFEDRQPERSRLTGYTGPVASGDVVFRPTGRTTLSFVADRSVGESVFATNLFYVSTIVTLAADHRITPKISANARVFGGINDYPDKATVLGQTKWRSDEIIGWGAGVDYLIQRWLALGLEYARQERESNFSSFDFVNDIVAARATLSF